MQDTAGSIRAVALGAYATDLDFCNSTLAIAADHVARLDPVGKATGRYDTLLALTVPAVREKWLKTIAEVYTLSTAGNDGREAAKHMVAVLTNVELDQGQASTEPTTRLGYCVRSASLHQTQHDGPAL